MSNSSFVIYTNLSPNCSTRTHDIDTITIHCMAGNGTIEACGNLFASPTRYASSNYGIDSYGRIGMYVPENKRSWCSSNSANDDRAVTIEVANNGGGPDWPVSDAAYNSLIYLVADICKRNGIKKLLWKGDKNLVGQIDKQNMTVHRWFDNKSCPGDYLYNRHGDIANKVNALLAKGGNIPMPAYTNPSTSSSTVNNGSLSKEQIAAMQAYYDTEADGLWGPNSIKAAGGLNADAAWKEYKSMTTGDIIIGNGYIQRTIPIAKIARIQIYNNKNRKTLDAIMQETGADFGVNGVLYNMSTWTPCENVKADGVILASQPKWSDEGVYWTNPADIKWGYVPINAGNAKNYFFGNGLIDNNGKQCNVNSWPADLKGSRGRTLFGIDRNNNIVIYSSLDGKAPLTPEGARNKMVSLNCTKGALNLDGGSSCGWYDKEHKLYQRPGKGTVQNYILIYFVHSATTTTPTTSTNANPYPVPKRILYRGMSGNDVKYVQYILYKIKYGSGTQASFVDGSFGPNTQAAVKAFQKANRLLADGIVGSATLKALQKVIL